MGKSHPALAQEYLGQGQKQLGGAGKHTKGAGEVGEVETGVLVGE